MGLLYVLPALFVLIGTSGGISLLILNPFVPNNNHSRHQVQGLKDRSWLGLQ